MTCALLAGACWSAQAAELGEPRVSSFIGQPLVADIELGMLEDPATPVQVRLAHPDVYRGAGIGIPPVLATLTMSVSRRDGRQFLHVTSLAPVDAAHLHLYLELVDGGQRNVRLATLWLTPDPKPAPPPVPVPAPAPEPAQQPAARPVLARVAQLQSRPAPAAPPKRANAPAKEPASAPAARPASEPRLGAAGPRPAVPAHKAPLPAPAARSAPLPVQAPVPRHLTGGSCAPQAPRQADACTVLDAKNAVLREQLGQLEDKVRVLQVAMGAAPASVLPPAKPIRPRKKKPEPAPDPGTPWLTIGAAAAGALALVAAVLVALRRRKAPPRAARQRQAAPKAGLGARLKAGLGRLSRRKGTPAEKDEPVLEAAAHNSSTQV